MFSGIRILYVEVYALDKILNDCNRLIASKGQPAIESGGFVGQTLDELFGPGRPWERMGLRLTDGWRIEGGKPRVGGRHQPPGHGQGSRPKTCQEPLPGRRLSEKG
jgi:hypothetical protein